MKTIYTAVEAAAFLARETGDLDITERDVFESIQNKGETPEGYISVVIQAGTLVLCRTGDDSDKWTSYTPKTPMELFVGGPFIDDFVKQLSLTGYGLPGQLSNGMHPPFNQRYNTSVPIPAADVRLPKQLVKNLLPGFKKLLKDIENGDVTVDRLLGEIDHITPSHAKAGPLPLTTREIADSFASLRWTAEEWIERLGNKPKWLEECLVTNRGRGEGMRLWNPVLIGAYLIRMNHVKANSVRAKFQTKPAIKPWLEDWKTYEADNFATE